MNYYKLGCNWGTGKPDFYNVLVKHSIVICAKHNMNIKDIVAITKGYDVVALARIKKCRVPVIQRLDLKEDFNSHQIDYADWNKIAEADIWELNKSEKFQYKLQQGICQIQNAKIKKTIDLIINSKIKDMEIEENLKNLLYKNKNLILTGAPGTGKTYLAEQIAERMILDEEKSSTTKKEIIKKQRGFVQFHPSYDYTDFVEGLRPNEKNGFERRNGVFKEFCKNALPYSVAGIYHSLSKELEKKNITLPLLGGADANLISQNGQIKADEKNSTKYPYTIDCSKIELLFLRHQGHIKEIKTIGELIPLQEEIEASYYWAVYEHIRQKVKPFVFIIDEINRGEISKIFGELFRSIEPGYRGEGEDGKCKVNTQYQNLVKKDDEFFKGFYVPENVYIIGTMNDIDRSVESMDFAFRRRFAFKEIKAKDTQKKMLKDLEWKDEAITRMDSLNDKISSIEGLSSAYHIGASYFLKLKNYDGDFNSLWNFHLEGLLREYLRGMQDVEDQIKKLKVAYDNEPNSDNGQQ